MTDLFWDDAHSDMMAPKIVRSWNQDDLGDDPDSHRWRANWYDTYDHDREGGRKVIGILMTAYPVLKLTPRGAWIDRFPYRKRVGTDFTWDISGSKRWVSNDGGAAFAKPTQADALFSIAYRLMRWHTKAINDVRRLRQAAEVCKMLLPEHSRFAEGIERSI